MVGSDSEISMVHTSLLSIMISTCILNPQLGEVVTHHLPTALSGFNLYGEYEFEHVGDNFSYNEWRV